MAKFLVTGGAGFIGSHLVDALIHDGHQVRVLDNLSTGTRANLAPRAEFILGDTTDYEVFRDAVTGVDGVFHMAAIASVEKGFEDWPGTHTINVTSFINVLDLSRRIASKPFPIVYASSAAVYGEDGRQSLSEDAPKRPVSAYGADKLGCENHAYVGANAYGIPSVGLRLFNVYGPRQYAHSPYSGVISIFCDQIKSGKEICIHGDGKQTRDFIYVSDAVRLLVAAMQSEQSGASIYNACTGVATSIRDLANEISRAIDIPLKVTHAPARRGDVRHSVGDSTRARDRFQWQAEVSLAEGLRQMMGITTRPAKVAPDLGEEASLRRGWRRLF